MSTKRTMNPAIASAAAKLDAVSANLDDPAFDESKGRWDAPRDDDVTSKLSKLLTPEEIAEINANPDRSWDWAGITSPTRNAVMEFVEANPDRSWDWGDFRVSPEEAARINAAIAENSKKDAEKYLVGHMKMHQYTYIGWLQVILALPNLYCLWRSSTAQVDAVDAATVTTKWLVDFTMNAYLISGGMEIVRGLMYLQHFSIYTTESPNEADAGTVHLELVGNDAKCAAVLAVVDSIAAAAAPEENGPIFVTMNADANTDAEPKSTMSRMLGAVNPVFHLVGRCVNIFTLLFYTRHLGYLNSPLATTVYVGNGLIEIYSVGSNLVSGIVRMFRKLM